MGTAAEQGPRQAAGTETGRTPPARQRPAWQRATIVAVIVVGLVTTGVFAARAARSVHEIQYIRHQGLDQGTASVDDIRPWMTIRFVAVAYAVPEEYLYSALAIPFDRRNANQSMGELNRTYGLGLTPGSGELAIIDRTRAAVSAYDANPVATGLRDVRGWMSVRYIANSTGVPAAEILAAAGLPADANQSKPLDMIAGEVGFPGGGHALAEAIARGLAQRKGAP